MDQKELPIIRHIVTTETFRTTLDFLKTRKIISLDTETSGLRPHHGDRIFALILACRYDSGELTSYYFNFLPDPMLPSNQVLDKVCWPAIQELFDQEDLFWFIQNAKFDMAMLAQENCYIHGTIHCTRALGRVERNDGMSYSLDTLAKKLGYSKDDAVENYIKTHKLWKWVDIPGKSARKKDKFYSQVPFEIMFKYASTDAGLCYVIGETQLSEFEKISQECQAAKNPDIMNIVANERLLTKVVFDMEYRGIKIDADYTEKAREYESYRMSKAAADFKDLTGEEFRPSPILYAKVLEDQKDQWEYTDKENPSFESAVLKKFKGPIATTILTLRDAKSRRDFYNGFLWHKDSQDFIHPIFNPDGTGTGRFSSSEPNFQNLTSEEPDSEFIVRRAIIPSRPGGWLASLDYRSMEYRMMLDLACQFVRHETELVRQIKGGLDVHQAVADLAGVTRSEAKTTNFLTIYGGGNAKLAEQLGVSLERALEIREAIFDAAPEIKGLIRAVTNTAENRKFIFNWSGRRCHFPDSQWAYKAPNYLIQGGCADIVKFAMPKIQNFLALEYPSVRMILQLHDEIVLDLPPCPKEQAQKAILEVKKIMEDIYPAKFLPMECEGSWSQKSLGDLEELQQELALCAAN